MSEDQQIPADGTGGEKLDRLSLPKKSIVDRLKPFLAKKNLPWLIAIGGFLITFLIFFAGGINYSGPIGKYGGTFLEHLQQQIGNGEKFNNFLIVTWFLVPLLGLIIGFLGLGSKRSRTRIGKRMINIYILAFALSAYTVLLAAMATIYNLRLTRTGDFFNPASELEFFYPKASPYPSVFISMGLILIIMVAALLNIVSTFKKEDRKTYVKAFITIVLVLVIAGMPFFIQIALVGGRANRAKSTYDTDQIGMNIEFYDYLSEVRFDIKRYISPGCHVVPDSIEHPPILSPTINFKGTPFENRDSRKAMFMNYIVRCNSYERAIGFYANTMSRAEVAHPTFYTTLSTSDDLDDILFVQGDSSISSIFISRAIIPKE
jgi:NADH:ubiquinone oxidoreductase subunit 6 (subunit J)